MIDPKSPLTHGLDVSGVPRKLGDLDDMGVLIGYIDHDGLCWESSEERDTAVVSARYSEAWFTWNESGGVLGDKPDSLLFALRFCNHAENIEAAMREAERDTDPSDPITSVRLARRFAAARWN